MIKNSLMAEISATVAAGKLGCTLEELKDHVFFVTWGNAWSPERFWDHRAFTREEYERINWGNTQCSTRKISWKGFHDAT